MAKRQTFKPNPRFPHLIPGTALVPMYPGAAVLNAFATGGISDATRWIRSAGGLDGQRIFDSLADADAAAERAGGYLARRADHFVFIARGGLFDPDAA